MSDKDFIISSDNFPAEEELNSLDRNEAANILKNISAQLSVYENIAAEKQKVKDFRPIGLFIIVAIIGIIAAAILFFILAIVFRFFFSRDVSAYAALFTSCGLCLYLAFDVLKTSITDCKKCKNHLNEFYSNESLTKDAPLFLDKVASLMGPDYSTSYIIGRFSNYFQNGRCSTLQQAKNIYTQELANEQMNAQLEAAAEEARSASAAAKAASKKASHARTMSFFNLFK